MTIKVFAIFDSKVGAYLRPFFMPTRGSALRAFIDTASDPSSAFHKHPADYNLFELGEFDELTGDLINSTPNVNLGSALELTSQRSIEASV